MAEPFECDNATHVLCKRIASAWAALNGARAATSHSPTGERCAIEDMCETTMNGLLEKFYEGMTEEQRAEAEARPVRERVRA